MKCQLVGFNNYSITNRETGTVSNACSLYFVRKPKLTENGVVGNVCVGCTVYDEAIKKLPDLKVGTNYDCDINSFKGKNYLNDMVEA